jgi:very-short-patch-repair endonuclease
VCVTGLCRFVASLCRLRGKSVSIRVIGGSQRLSWPKLPAMNDGQAPRNAKATGAELDWLLGCRMDPRSADTPIAGLVWLPEGVRRGEGDPEVARIALAQRAFIHRQQLLAAGLSGEAVKHRLRKCVLHPYFRDVYLFGRTEPEPLGAATAAVLHFRGHAVVSHRSAAVLWGLAGGAPRVPTVTVVGRNAHSTPRVQVHRVLRIDRRDLRRRAGLPVTSAARAVVELAGSSDHCADLELDLENAVARCIDGNLASEDAIRAGLGRTPTAKGAALLRRILDGGEPALTRSERERRLRRLLRDAQLPQPISNDMVLNIEVDFHWREQRVVVEFDGWGTHRGRRSFESDRKRDQRLVAAGYRVLRITARQLKQEPLAVIARLAAALTIGAYWSPPVAAAVA